MNARAAFLVKDKPQGGEKQAATVPLVVPTSAIRESGGKKSLFVVFEGKAIEKTVKLGNTTTKGIEVADGLMGGEEIVINPPQNLKDGDKVAIKQKQS
jgi:HlyD family secretion protein